MKIAYYNEIDPKAAAWLRELIKQGHIAPGDVDVKQAQVLKGDISSCLKGDDRLDTIPKPSLAISYLSMICALRGVDTLGGERFLLPFPLHKTGSILELLGSKNKNAYSVSREAFFLLSLRGMLRQIAAFFCETLLLISRWTHLDISLNIATYSLAAALKKNVFHKCDSRAQQIMIHSEKIYDKRICIYLNKIFCEYGNQSFPFHIEHMGVLSFFHPFLMLGT